MVDMIMRFRNVWFLGWLRRELVFLPWVNHAHNKIQALFDQFHLVRCGSGRCIGADGLSRRRCCR